MPDPGAVRRAYKEIARRYHPDKTAGDGAALMATVNEAFNVLNDPARRAPYDEQLARRRAARRAEAELARRAACRARYGSAARAGVRYTPGRKLGPGPGPAGS